MRIANRKRSNLPRGFAESQEVGRSGLKIR